jgi:DNA gyrase subunit A
LNLKEKPNVIDLAVTEAVTENYMPYAMSVIAERALPEIDGFKPAHRKLLYTMYKMGLLNGRRTKSANIVGQTMKLNPHGDMAIYDTMVRLTQENGALAHGYVDGKGNFGDYSSSNVAPASARYTEAKLSKISRELFMDLDKNPVDFMDSYDGEMKEPTLLPTTFPNIIVSPNIGIAVGMACSIPPFNLREVCQTAIEYIKNPDVDIMEFLLAPDFPTGGQLLYDKEAISTIYETGKSAARGGIKLRAKYDYKPKSSYVEIYEIPYTTTIEAIIDKVDALVKKGTLKEITDINDNSDLNGLNITIDIKRNTDVEALMNKLFSLTPLQDSFSCNFNILLGNKPKVMGIKQILDNWIEFRMTSIKRQIQHDIDIKQEKIHLFKGLEKIDLNIDRAIEIIRNSPDSKIISSLMEEFEIDEVQANYVADIKLRYLNKDYVLIKSKESQKLEQEVKKLNNTLNNKKLVENIITKQLETVAKEYGIDRKTEILYDAEPLEAVSPNDLIEDYNCSVFLTKEGYLKKIRSISLRANNSHKLKENDIVMQEIETSNDNDLLMFSNKGMCYKLKLYELDEHKASVMGEYLTSLLQLSEDESILKLCITKDYSGQLLFAFENGKVAKIPLKLYETKTKRRKLVNAMNVNSNLTNIIKIDTDNDIDILCKNSIDKLLIFNSSNIKEIGTKNSPGIEVMKIRKGVIMDTSIPVSNVSGIENIKHYFISTFPTSGKALRKTDSLENINTQGKENKEE